MRKQKLFVSATAIGLIIGGVIGFSVSGDFVGVSSVACLVGSFGFLVWLVAAYLLDD